MKRPNVVPLPAQARELIARLPGADELIFTTNGRTPVSGWSKIKRRLDSKMNIPHWRLHDLRRTAATGMAEIGVSPHIVEAVLNHVSGARASVAGVYNRAVYATEKRAALWNAGLRKSRGWSSTARQRLCRRGEKLLIRARAVSRATRRACRSGLSVEALISGKVVPPSNLPSAG